MKLPNASRAIVDESKVVQYLLSADHPDGRSKATFFANFGFRLQRWEALVRALRDHGSKTVLSRLQTDAIRGYGPSGSSIAKATPPAS